MLDQIAKKKMLYADMIRQGRSPMSMFQQLADDPSKESKYGARLGDNGEKGTGFYGLLQRPGGGVSTELSIGVELGGKETLIPSLVPGLTQDEINQLLSSSGIPQKSIQMKAVDHARKRIAQGLSPFWQEGEPTITAEYEY